jgi:hypothetical protein
MRGFPRYEARDTPWPLTVVPLKSGAWRRVSSEVVVEAKVVVLPAGLVVVVETDPVVIVCAALVVVDSPLEELVFGTLVELETSFGTDEETAKDVEEVDPAERAELVVLLSPALSVHPGQTAASISRVNRAATAAAPRCERARSPSRVSV